MTAKENDKLLQITQEIEILHSELYNVMTRVVNGKALKSQDLQKQFTKINRIYQNKTKKVLELMEDVNKLSVYNGVIAELNRIRKLKTVTFKNVKDKLVDKTLKETEDYRKILLENFGDSLKTRKTEILSQLKRNNQLKNGQKILETLKIQIADVSASLGSIDALTDNAENLQILKINGRNYNAKKHLRTIIRSESAKFHTLGTLNTAEEFDTDLVRVSSHNTLTPLCQEFEGKVYSISGKDKRFEKLPDDKPPYHPNCKHVLNVEFVSSLYESGRLEGDSDFSLGKRDAPAGNTGYVPLKDRNKEAKS